MAMQMVATLVASATLATGSVVGVQALASDEAGSVEQPTCGAVWQRLPDDLRRDLGRVLRLPPEQRAAAAREVRLDALDGDYGPRVRSWVEGRSARVREVWSRLPEALRADLEEVRALPAEERRDALAGVRDEALAGAYGPDVQRLAQRLQERREACLPDGP